MGASPTVKEVNVDLAGFKSSVDKQFEHVDKDFGILLKWTIGLYVLVGSVVGGGFVLRGDLGEIKASVARTEEKVDGLRRDLTSLQGQVAAIQKDTQDASNIQKQVLTTLVQINNKLPSTNPSPTILVLSPSEEKFLRDFFKLGPGGSKVPPKFKVGDPIAGGAPLPDALVDQIPRLKGFNYERDPGNNAVLIVYNGRVVAALEPS